MMRKSWVLGLILFLFSFSGISQEEPSLEMFYGKRDLKGGGVNYNLLLNTPGGIGAFELFYLTQAKKSAYLRHWLNYYGVSVEFASGEGKDYDFREKGEGDFNVWWLGIWIDGRKFYQDTTKLRPYFNYGAGFAIGEMSAEGKDFEIPWRELDLFQVKLGAGVEAMLNQNWSLDLGINAKAGFGMMGGIIDSADTVLSGIEFKIGLSQWSENKRR